MSHLPPIPVQPIAYAEPVGGRPGVLTAMGVISIVVASLSILASAAGVLYASMFMAFAGFRMGAFPAGGTMQVQPAEPLEVGPRGIELPAARAEIIEVFKLAHPLSDERTVQLEALLAKAGQDMFDWSIIDPDSIGLDVSLQISDSGQLYRPAGNGPIFYELSRGRVELSDDQGLFVLTDGNETRVSIDVLRSMGDDPSLEWYTPNSSTTVVQNPDGSTTTVMTTTAVQGTGAPAGAAAAPSTLRLGGRIAIAEAILSFLLAVLLLIAGILVLRDSPRAGRLHWVFALGKIPLVVLGTLGWMWLWEGFFANMGGPTTTGFGWSFGFSAAIWAVIALIYPIALMIVLRTRTVREYYSTGR